MFRTVIAAFAMVWQDRRTLLPPLIAVLVPMFLAHTLWRLAVSSELVTIANDRLSIPAPAGWLAWTEAIVITVAWTWAVTMCVRILTGCPAIRGSLRNLVPALGALLLVAFAAGIALAVWFVLPPSPFVSLPIMLGSLLLVAVLGSRLALVLPISVSEGLGGTAALSRATELTRGRRTYTTGSIVLGLVILPLLLGKLADVLSGLWTWSLSGLVARLLTDLVLVLVAATQVAVLLVTYWRLAAESPATGGTATARPTPASATRLPGALALLLVPALLTGAVVQTGAYPRTTQHGWEHHGGILAMGWPDDGNPVVVTYGGIIDCLDAECREDIMLSFHGRHWEAAAVGVDGSVVAVNAGQLLRCDTNRECDVGPEVSALWDKMRDNVEHHLATSINVTADGSILLAIAREADADMSRVDIELLRCGDLTCADLSSAPIGTVVLDFQDDGDDAPPLLAVTPSGQVWFRSEHGGPAWLGTPNRGLHPVELPGAIPNGEHLALATVGSGLYLVTAERAPGGALPEQLWSGAPGQYQIVLHSCTDTHRGRWESLQLDQITDLGSFTGAWPRPQLVWLAGGPDGQVVLIDNLHGFERVTTARF